MAVEELDHGEVGVEADVVSEVGPDVATVGEGDEDDLVPEAQEPQRWVMIWLGWGTPFGIGDRHSP